MKNIIIIVGGLILLASCNPNQTWTKKTIDGKEQKLMTMARQGHMDSLGVKDLLDDYEAYATKYPNDTAGAGYLFKAAEFYRYLHKPAKSIETYRKIYNNYPGFESRPYALFLQGFIFENELGKTDSARVIYEDFLNKYPSDALAKDVRITLNNLGKSPEELINEFEEKQHADSLAQAK